MDDLLKTFDRIKMQFESIADALRKRRTQVDYTLAN